MLSFSALYPHQTCSSLSLSCLWKWHHHLPSYLGQKESLLFQHPPPTIHLSLSPWLPSGGPLSTLVWATIRISSLVSLFLHLILSLPLLLAVRPLYKVNPIMSLSCTQPLMHLKILRLKIAKPYIIWPLVISSTSLPKQRGNFLVFSPLLTQALSHCFPSTPQTFQEFFTSRLMFLLSLWLKEIFQLSI